MNPAQSWKALSLLVVLAVAVVASALLNQGLDTLPIASGIIVILLVYPYVLYKRYHVEVIPGKDIALLNDTDDLRLLCRIYGLRADGGRIAMKERLLQFVDENRGQAFAWVAPKAVVGLGSAFSIEPRKAPLMSMEHAEGEPEAGRSFSGRSRLRIEACPLCGARAAPGAKICSVCGADMEFHSSVAETRIGKMLATQREAAMKHKGRYPASSSGGRR